MKLFFYSTVAINKTTNELSHCIGTKRAENETALIAELKKEFLSESEGGEYWTEPSILVEEVL